MAFDNASNSLLSSTLCFSAFGLITLGFYAQLILNWKRKKISGLSIDYILFGLFSYFFYAIFISCYHFLYFYIPFIRLDSTIIDIVFALHSILCFILISTQAVLEWDKTYRHLTLLTKITLPSLLIVLLLLYIISLAIKGNHLNYTAYGLLMSFYLLYAFKYYFQIAHNNSKKSTIGFGIASCLFDLGGNVSALLYYSYNFYLANQTISSNLIGLICFLGAILGDSTLILQHWVLFNNSNSDLGEYFFENYLINRLE